VQGREPSRNRSRDYFERIFSSCFYETPGLPRELSALRGQLDASHVADGFEPVVLDAAAHTLDPLELILRAYHVWEHGRWPGRNGRLSYARVLSGVFLLRPCTAIESLFVERDSGGIARGTDMGTAHNEVLRRYGQLIGETAERLREDATSLDPQRNPYSPLGIACGFCADLLSHLASTPLHGQPAAGLSLEDMFVTHEGPEARLACARAWERLPVRRGERERLDHSPEWAGHVFLRTTAALDARAAHPTERNASNLASARIFVVPRGRIEGPPPDGVVPAQEHCVTSDVNRAMVTGTTAFPKSQILSDRND
jgi:hypothetical protein